MCYAASETGNGLASNGGGADQSTWVVWKGGPQSVDRPSIARPERLVT